jgi:lipoprotein signal peptidase
MVPKHPTQCTDWLCLCCILHAFWSGRIGAIVFPSSTNEAGEHHYRADGARVNFLIWPGNIICSLGEKFLTTEKMKNPLVRASAFFFLVLVVDQVSKLQFFPPGGAVNPGISFGFLDALPAFIWALLLIGVQVILLWALRSFWKTFPALTGLFFGGAFSNVLDRILLGGVRDWLPIPFTQIKNNLADWFICFALIVFFFYKTSKKVTS